MKNLHKPLLNPRGLILNNSIFVYIINSLYLFLIINIEHKDFIFIISISLINPMGTHVRY